MTDEETARLVREARVSLGLSVRRVAELSGLNRATVTRIEEDPSAVRQTSVALVLRALRDQGADVPLMGDTPREDAAAPTPPAPDQARITVTIRRDPPMTFEVEGPVAALDVLADAVWRLAKPYVSPPNTEESLTPTP